MSDFMREVDEEYRRERTMRFLSRYQVLIALVIVGIVVGAGVWRYMVDRRIAAAEADNSRYQAAERLARDGDAAQAGKSFDALAVDGVAGYPLLARMRAAEELAAGDPEAAAKRFDAIASEDGAHQALRDTARYRGALLRVDHEDPTKFEDQYGRFALQGFTYQAGMRELLALAALKRGDAATAQRYFSEIIIDPASPVPLRNRAQAFLDLARSGAASVLDKPAPPATVTPASAAKPAPVAQKTAAPASAPASAAAPSPSAAPSAASSPAPSSAQPTSPTAPPH